MQHLKLTLQGFFRISFFKKKKMTQVYDFVQTKSEGNTHIVWSNLEALSFI